MASVGQDFSVVKCLHCGIDLRMPNSFIRSIRLDHSLYRPVVAFCSRKCNKEYVVKHGQPKDTGVIINDRRSIASPSE
jgi:hypothetical protein